MPSVPRWFFNSWMKPPASSASSVLGSVGGMIRKQITTKNTKNTKHFMAGVCFVLLVYLVVNLLGPGFNAILRHLVRGIRGARAIHAPRILRAGGGRRLGLGHRHGGRHRGPDPDPGRHRGRGVVPVAAAAEPAASLLPRE